MRDNRGQDTYGLGWGESWKAAKVTNVSMHIVNSLFLIDLMIGRREYHRGRFLNKFVGRHHGLLTACNKAAEFKRCKKCIWTFHKGTDQPEVASPYLCWVRPLTSVGYFTFTEAKKQRLILSIRRRLFSEKLALWRVDTYVLQYAYSISTEDRQLNTVTFCSLRFQTDFWPQCTSRSRRNAVVTNNHIERYFGVMKDVLLRGRQLTSLVALMTLLNGDAYLQVWRHLLYVSLFHPYYYVSISSKRTAYCQIHARWCLIQ